MQESILSEKQYRDLTQQIVHSLESKSRIVPLNSLKHPNYYLKTPVFITLEYDEDAVIASFNDIEAFAFGDTESEALDRLCREIVTLCEDLVADSDALGPLPSKWLSCLREIIGCR